jgi:thioredoxin
MKLIGLTSYVFIIMLAGCSTNRSKNLSINISATAFAEKISQLPSAPIVDVRTPEEFSKGHLHKARNIDWNGSDFLSEISKLDKSKPVFVYCLSGGRSAAAVNQMRSEGFQEIYELQGGIMKWRAAGFPETKSNELQSAGMSKPHFDSLTNSEKMVLVDFYADWCVPCKKMKPFIDEISTTMTNMVSVVRINADENQQLCRELGINTLPVLQLYKNKGLSWTNSGYITKEELMKKLF